MAKRLQNEQEYRPVLKRVRDIGPDRSLVEAVMGGAGQGAAPQLSAPEAPGAAAAAAPARIERPAPAPAAPPPIVDLPRRKQESERAPTPKMAYEPPTLHERFKVTHSEKMENRSLITRHAEALGANLSFSHVMRAWLTILRNGEKEILRALERVELRRPPNDDALGLADFEHKLSHIYLEALRNAPPIEREG